MSALRCTREARARIVAMTVHIDKLVLGTGYSSTVAGVLHMQLHMDDVIVDDVMILRY